MLRKIKISGFKSFKDFDLELRPGLNVLVGPNGAGKTNLIKFLEFLSFLPAASLFDSIGKAGGAGTIFRRENGGIVPELSFSINGRTPFFSRFQEREQIIEYQYDATISISLTENIVFFSYQRIAIKSNHKNKKMNTSRRGTMQTAFDFLFTQTADGEFKKEVKTVSENLSSLLYVSRGKNNRDEIANLLSSIPDEQLKNHSVLSLLEFTIEYVDAIHRDLRAGSPYNIDPNVVREPEHIGSEPNIKPNGSGLAAMLFAAKSLEDPAPAHPWPGGWVRKRYPALNKALFAELIRYSTLVNDSIRDIDVDREPIENKLRVFVEIDYESGSLPLPLHLCSDGTVKWLALVAAILASRSAFVIEEPENFLHPSMQREIISIIRENAKKDNFTIMTTHSETLINCLQPKELILLNLEDGRSRATRPSNDRKLIEQINETGFGLSYYLNAGILDR